MNKETDALIYFLITCVLVVWNSIQVLSSIGRAEYPIIKVTPDKKTPTQLKKMLKNDLVNLVLEYQ